MYLFTEYVFRESVDSAHNSQISSTFQEADCLLKLVKINKQVFVITLLSRNLNHTAQLSISARGGIIILSVGLGGGKKRKRPCDLLYQGVLQIIVESLKSHSIPSEFTHLSFEISLLCQICHCCLPTKIVSGVSLKRRSSTSLSNKWGQKFFIYLTI